MEKFEDKVKHYIKVHRELHGNGFKQEDVVRDFVGSFPEVFAMDVLHEVERQEKNKVYTEARYGLFIGRCMPFHNGHNAIVQDIIRDGRTPIIILGGKDKVDERHPLSYEDRVQLIKKIYPFGVKFIGLTDKNDWTEWYDSVKEELQKLGVKKEQLVLYAHNKNSDKTDFKYRGKEYADASYTEMFTDNGVQIKEMSGITCDMGEVIHASDVREFEKVAERNLDARIFRTLKDKYKWYK